MFDLVWTEDDLLVKSSKGEQQQQQPYQPYQEQQQQKCQEQQLQGHEFVSAAGQDWGLESLDTADSSGISTDGSFSTDEPLSLDDDDVLGLLLDDMCDLPITQSKASNPDPASAHLLLELQHQQYLHQHPQHHELARVQPHHQPHMHHPNQPEQLVAAEPASDQHKRARIDIESDSDWNDDEDGDEDYEPATSRRKTSSTRRGSPQRRGSARPAAPERAQHQLVTSAAAIQLPVGAPRGLDLNPRCFRDLVQAMGAHVTEGAGQLGVMLNADQQHPHLGTPIMEKLSFVQHEKTYVMSCNIGSHDRRRHDVFHEMLLDGGETMSFWCDQGNAHYVLETAQPLRDEPEEGKHLNPRTVQVAHALANRVSRIVETEVPVVKCFYYALCERPVYADDDSSSSSSSSSGGAAPTRKRKRATVASGRAGARRLGLYKHVYMLCDQSIKGRHKPLAGSTMWLARYFVKDKDDLHPTIANRVCADNPTMAKRTVRDTKKQQRHF